MALDLFFRADNQATYIDWLTRSSVRAIIGDLRVPNGLGGFLSGRLRGIAGNVYLKLWDVNQIVQAPAIVDDDGNIITPAVMDPQAWIQVRLTGDAEIRDFAGPPDPDDVDRWERSRMVTLVSAGIGKPGLHRGVSLFVRKLFGKNLAVFRGSEVDAMIKFHEFFGGNFH